ncbi:MAG TPA: aspartate--tRNA(Asn) ligase [bacterium]|nr:aspartate--tRNA(Asn) ligase [bacterium]
MKERTLIKNLNEHVGKVVNLSGRILNLRELGTITFAQLHDYSGYVQAVFDKQVEFKMGEVVSIEGEVIKEDRSKTGFEIHAKSASIISKNSEELPIDLAKKDLRLQLPTLLDNRTLSLRHPKIQAVFKLYDLLLEQYEMVMREEGFTEIKTPKILGAASEGGANFFSIEYFEKKAYLAQSPQFYKQIMVGVFERVFEIGSTFRAEPHFTTRHVNEYISLDAEMGMIEGFNDVTSMLNRVLKRMFKRIGEEGKDLLAMYGVEMPTVPEKIPHIKLKEIKKIIKEKYGYEVPADTDIDPQGERFAGQYAKEQLNSDFLFVTHYPWKDKPFYTMPSRENEEETEGFDLLFRGMEIVTGSQRIHTHELLMENMKKKGVSPKGMEFYLDTFKFAMPPHGGWGMGSERLIQQILGLDTIKEAILFPRDVKRLVP